VQPTAGQLAIVVLDLWRFALAEREREAASARGHVRDGGHPPHNATARREDVEECGVCELEAAVGADFALGGVRTNQAIDRACRPVGERDAEHYVLGRRVLAAVGGDAVMDDEEQRAAENRVIRAWAGEDRAGRVDRYHLRRAGVSRGARRQRDDECERDDGKCRDTRNSEPHLPSSSFVGKKPRGSRSRRPKLPLADEAPSDDALAAASALSSFIREPNAMGHTHTRPSPFAVHRETRRRSPRPCQRT